MPSSSTPLLLLALSGALLTACNSMSATPTSALGGDRPGQTAPRYDYVASVPLTAMDTPETIQAELKGTVLAWNTSGCATGAADGCVALVGMNTAATLTAQSLALRPMVVEQNKDQFSAGGEVTATMGGSRALWAGGSLLAWTGGSRALWAGGTYAPVPQNNDLWTTVHLQQAQTLAPNLGAGVTVAVIDTGLDLVHPAFQGALTAPSTWKDYVGGDAVPQDEGTLGTGGFGHGTNVAGIVLQVAPKAKIMPIRVLGSDGSGDVVNIANAINWAVSNGANVINLSLGASKDSKVIADAISAAAAKNVLVVSSAGNENLNKITYPAANSEKISGLLSVGSVNPQDVKSSFSNYSKDLELVAPGENVYAPAPGNLMAAWSGTSMAAPMASGALALALGQTLKVSVSSLPTALMSSAVNVYTNPLNSAYTKDSQLGSGRLDLSAFLARSIR